MHKIYVSTSKLKRNALLTVLTSVFHDLSSNYWALAVSAVRAGGTWQQEQGGARNLQNTVFQAVM